MKKIVLATLFVGLSSFAFANSVYSPAQGVICDKKAGFCSDSYGISIGMTKEYLGKKNADTWSKRVSSNGFDSQSFTMSNGVSCDTRKKVCKKSKWDKNADAHWTRILFGKSAGHTPASGNQDEMIGLGKKDCINFISQKFGLSKSTIHVSGGKHNGSKVTIPVRINSKEPRVEEKGKCIIKDGDVRYKPSY